MNRRSFLSSSGKSVAGAALAGLTVTAFRPGSALGANERVNVALIGCGGRGRYDIRGLVEQGAHATFLCDLLTNRLDETAKFVAAVQKEEPAKVKEMRQVLDSKDVDAVVIGLPDQWHAPASIMACQARKDVYVEKPHSHNLWESGQMVAAAKKYERVLQVGTQNRSGPYTLAAREYVKSGKLGKIALVRVFNMKAGGPFKLGDPGKPPEGFDWDTWLGPAPTRPYHQHIFRGGWHSFWDFCSGDMGDDGIHQLDLALMLMGDPPAPKSVRCLGGRYAYRGDDSECPDVQLASWDYGDFVMSFELTGYPRYMDKTSDSIRRNDELPYWTMNATRIELYGSQLLMTIGRHGGGWIVQQSGGRIVEKMFGRPCDEPHYANFLECVKTRKKANADISIAHASNVALHMGNIAHRVGNVALTYDPKANQFDNPEANKLLKPPYRKGYEIPDEV